MSSITRVLHTKTWDYFASRLPSHFNSCPEEVKEAIMTDIDDLLQEFWRTSSDGASGSSFLAMRRLLEILQGCFDFLEVCFDNISVFATAIDFANEIYRCRQGPIPVTILPGQTLMTKSESNLRYCLMGIERC